MLECQPRSKEEQVNGFVNMVMRRIKKGCSACHVVFIFPAQYTDWVDETHIEQHLSSDFDEIRIRQCGKALVLPLTRSTRVSSRTTRIK
jgi:hypothetical protein